MKKENTQKTVSPLTALRDNRLRVGLLICTCFLLGSTGWLAWLYRITALAEPSMVDFYTMVLGYLAQALGICIYLAVRCKAGEDAAFRASVAAMFLYVVLMEPATMSFSLATVLGFGYAMNVVCGFFSGHYLSCLAGKLRDESRGTAFGAGYAVSTFLTWLLSNVGNGVLADGIPNLIVCTMLAALGSLCMRAVALSRPDADSNDTSGRFTNGIAEEGFEISIRSLLILAGTAVVLASAVKNMGFSFPTSDLSGSVDLELSRLFYGVGLIAAGIVADRNRNWVLACCAGSLVTPFLMLALSGAGASGITLWALGYLLYGFFAVWRITLFADLATLMGKPWLAGLGLLLGRVGDAIGACACIALAAFPLALIAVSLIVFVAAAVLFVVLFQRFYNGGTMQAVEEMESARMASFCERYSLSERESEVAALVLGKMTNVKIAEQLFVSESTVKFHVRNILKKTGCSNRVELAELYERDSN